MTASNRNCRGLCPDVDEQAVYRAISGDRSVVLTWHELQEAVSVLTGHGLSARAIGNRLGVSSRTVQRHRAAK